MATQQELQAQLASLEEARSLGAKKVRFQSHEVEYHSIADIEAAINSVKRQLREAMPAPRIVHVQGVKGYRS